MKNGEWRAYDNGPIEKLHDNLWEVEGSVPGFPMKRRMTLVRLPEDAQRELEAWGTVRFIIVPNGWHRLDAAAYAARYPDALVLCPDPAAKRVHKVVRVDGNLSRLPTDPTLEHAPLAGSSIAEHVLTVRSGNAATLVFADTLFNIPARLPGFKGFVYDLIGSTGGPRVTPLLCAVAVRDRKALAHHLTELAAIPGLSRVIPGHGDTTEDPAASRAALTTAANSL
jgi:pimeloyl-ACP methyl ester carboxylesterase